jgi:hypothetical protein
VEGEEVKEDVEGGSWSRKNKLVKMQIIISSNWW